MKKFLQLIVPFFLLVQTSLFGINDLSVKDNNSHGSKPGYIDKATLVIEPFGSFVEQSLYLEYSGRNQFTSNLLEIVHRFELPKDAVIEDMWLWIGDSVMQARMYDTWSARSVYDSIVAAHYDPAFLAKNGDQYEFKIYPLAAGSRRKVKISFIVPTLWYGNEAVAELPLKLLQSNNAEVKPLEILYRTSKDIWGTPTIREDSELEFVDLTDTLNYKFRYLLINDISDYSSLNLNYNTDFSDGYYIDGYQDKSNSTYFQLGILPKDFFNAEVDSSSNDVLVALDFSGSHNKNFNNNLPIYQDLVGNSLKTNDRFKLIVSGIDQIVDYTGTFIETSRNNIAGAFNEFKTSEFAESIDKNTVRNILFCDGGATAQWDFPELETLANRKVYSNIISAKNDISSSDIVAAYNHGYDDPINQSQADLIIQKLDSLFLNGGRFLTYYDYNREGKEKLASHYINGLHVKKKNSNALTLYRNPAGNIGINFPESFTRNAAYFLQYDDPDVKIELMDQSGDPAVISKKIKNGLLVVSGIWAQRDDAGLKAMQAAVLLGVNANSSPFTLDKFLTRIKQEHESDNFSKVILISDSDSLISINDSKQIITDYVNEYGDFCPTFSTINLLDNSSFTPPSLTENQTEYYGSGYLLNQLSEQSNGIHVEKHYFDWNYLFSLFSPYAVPNLNDLKIEATVDDGTGSLEELREINKFPDPNKPRFFIGKSNAEIKMDFSVSGKFEGTDLDSTRGFEFLVPHDTTASNKIISSMLGYEKITDLFNEEQIDTTQIVSLSIQYNLLTDYTALLALEPNDTLRFMRNPFDESGLTDVEDEIVLTGDSTYVEAYPNPFNSMVTFKFHFKNVSRISAAIYNSLGEEIATITDGEQSSGNRIYEWNGNNHFGYPVSSGFYIFRAIVTDKTDNNKKVFAKKLMYLK